MNTTILITALLVSIFSLSATTASEQDQNNAPDGLYRVTVDESGNTVKEFTPFDELVKSSPKLERRGRLEKRREHCGPGSVSANEADDANACLINSFPAGNNVYLNAKSWVYCVRGSVVSFICPYSNGYKPKDSIKGTWAYVKQKCGPSILGYAQVSNGVGDWTAGYAAKTDHFCTKDFKVGS